MPEIKHSFTGGKMNKDLYERLVPNGEYRNALNVQVRTTDGDANGVGAAGTVQNLESNFVVSNDYLSTSTHLQQQKPVGSISDEKNDVGYFFMASPQISELTIGDISDEQFWIDTIYEQHVDGTTTPVVVDIYGISNTWENVQGAMGQFANNAEIPSNSNIQAFPNWYRILCIPGQSNKFRVDMEIQIYDSLGNMLLNENTKISAINVLQGGVIELVLDTTQQGSTVWEDGEYVVVKMNDNDRLLNFDQENIITGINIIDNLLFWTDGRDEPRKVNIDRCKKGSMQSDEVSGTDFITHTKLFVENPATQEIVNINEIENITDDSLKKEHITVIRRAPTSAPSITMSSTDREGGDDAINSTCQFAFVNDDLSPSQPDIGIIRENIEVIGEMQYRVGDRLLFEDNSTSTNLVRMQGYITNLSFENGNTIVDLKITFKDPDVTSSNISWEVSLEQGKPLFELKLGRFGYRYKYEDGEYSSFSPWSELAFEPGKFMYTPSNGYNMGMVNTIRLLTIKDFIPNTAIRPIDVKTVEILFKSTDNSNVYVVKSITREIDSEWELFTESESENTGSITLTSEMIHKVVESNQILRSWDNVPKYALAQEITGNRLVYGNYTQGYDLDSSVGLEQWINTSQASLENPAKSIKSIRSYKFGMVFGDKYGRETPVISSGYTTGSPGDTTTTTGDIVVGKQFCDTGNSFSLTQNWTDDPPSWIDYVKYYVKETSNEYYNLVMDRWYDAQDGNVWISFASADRNKVDEETYLILKNEHGGQTPVLDDTKYKILAIENEAPDYIKENDFTFTRIRLGAEDVYSDPSSNPTLPNRLIERAQFTWVDQITVNSWTGSDVGAHNFKGQAWCRVYAEWYNSTTTSGEPVAKGHTRWIKVSQFVAGQAQNLNPHGIVLDSVWLASEVDMYTHFAATLGYDSDITPANVASEGAADEIRYFLEFKDSRVENRPEFDGRFFVKIEKDASLSDRVLHETQGEYVVSDVFDFTMISTQTFNPASYYWDGSETQIANAGPYFDEEWNDPATDFNSSSAIEQVEQFANTGETQAFTNDEIHAQTANFWQYWEANTETKIFLDHACLFDADINEADFIIDEGIDQLVSNQFDGWGTNIESTYINHWDIVPSSGAIGPRKIEVLFDNVGRFGNYVLDPENSTEVYGVNLEDLWLTQYIAGNNPGYAQMSWPEDDPAAKSWRALGTDSPLGSNDNPQINYLTFSTLGSVWEPGTETTFKNKMLTEGQLFRFREDPQQCVYRIKSQQRMYKVRYDGDIIQTQITLPYLYEGNIKNSKNSSNANWNRRSMLLLYFVKIDPETGFEVMLEGGGNAGMSTNDWDFRSHLHHWGLPGDDGLGGKLAIEFLNQEQNTSLSENSFRTSSACWETEPKKVETDLDLYYEASGAIPIRLNNDNIIPFVSPKSKTSNKAYVSIVNKPGLGSMYVNDVAGTSVQVYDSISNSVQGFGIEIGDKIKFRHSDGLVTMSEIIGVTNIDEDGNIVPPESLTTTVGIISVFQPQESSYYPLNEEPQPCIVILGSGASPATGYSNATFQNFLDQNPLVSSGNGDDTFGSNSVVSSYEFEDFGSGIWVYIIYLQGQSVPSVFINNWTFTFTATSGGWFELDPNVYEYEVKLSWFNCYSFGNGVESDRIRDDYNAPQIDNGNKVSTTFLDYGQETRTSGLIYSGLYNSTSGVNNLNEFNMAEKITKDLNPSYGSIQALKTRDTDVVVFTEDKVLKILSNKDAVFNADGNANLTATNKVLGTAMPFIGDYGISKNPESLAADQYRLYFTDKQRGAVLRLSKDGLTPISNVGMKSWFKTNLRNSSTIVGTFDTVNGEYNVTLDPAPTDPDATVNTPLPTVSFNEGSKGWVSFKSFAPKAGVSVSGRYLTTNDNQVWQHYSTGAIRNNFYGLQYTSSVNVVFNDIPGSIKNFKTVNYEGSQGRVVASTGQYFDDYGNTLDFLANDGEYYNLFNKDGWYVESVTTDMQSGQVPEFIQKEGKWFNKISGKDIETYTDINTGDFTTQGLGFPTSVGDPALIEDPIPGGGGPGADDPGTDPNDTGDWWDNTVSFVDPPAVGDTELASGPWAVFTFDDGFGPGYSTGYAPNAYPTGSFGIEHQTALSGDYTKEAGDEIVLSYYIMLREPGILQDDGTYQLIQGTKQWDENPTVWTKVADIGDNVGTYELASVAAEYEVATLVEEAVTTTFEDADGTYEATGSNTPQQSVINKNITVTMSTTVTSADGNYGDNVKILILEQEGQVVPGGQIGIRDLSIQVKDADGVMKFEYILDPTNIEGPGGSTGNITNAANQVLGTVNNYQHENMAFAPSLYNQPGSEYPNIDGWREFATVDSLIFTSYDYYPF